MQDFTETGTTSHSSAISLGSCQEYYRDLPPQFHLELDLLGQSFSSNSLISTSSSTEATETETENTSSNSNSDHNDNDISAPMSPVRVTQVTTKPCVAFSSVKELITELEHSTPETLALTVAASCASLGIPLPPLSTPLPPSCPLEELQVPVQLVPVTVTPVQVVPVTPLEEQVEDCSRIKVAIRLRPLATQELLQPQSRRPRRGSALGEERAWSLVPGETTASSSGSGSGGCTLLQKGASRKTPGRTVFAFDAVFDESSHTSQVYQDIARPIVKGVASGRHGTIFSYGQTGSGKTHTMQGCGESMDAANLGIIQMAAVDLFRMIESSSSLREYVVKAQYFEIYNEQIRDLLSADNTKTTRGKTDSLLQLPILSAREDPVTQNVHVNAYEEKVNGIDDVCRLLWQGNHNRACAVTNSNAQSSRSHAIFRLALESRERGVGELGDQTMRVSVLNMVDLAGSENSMKAGVTGIRKREGGNINQSLLALSRVIHALSLPAKKRPKHISYRDAKLTRILQPHLSGNACMAILCCASASSLHVEETRSTLKFAASAKLIQMKPTVNEVVDHRALLKKLQIELAETKEALRKLQNCSDVDKSKGPGASFVPVADLLPSRCRCESMRTQTTAPDLQTESGSTGGASGEGIEDNNSIPLQMPGLGKSASKSKEAPPVSEVWFSMESALRKSCDDVTTQLDEAEKRSKYLEDKLGATDDLVETLVRELEKARVLKDHIGAGDEKDGTNHEGEGRVMRQYLHLKYAICLGVLFYIVGQTDKLLTAVMFLLLCSF